MSSRTYLSIGDVLTLLRQEFPDVTISKIRFLESQGLVDPERTPSGYRKFYEPDVERLRWVLRQQREHFLPLKVIKGRLDEGAEADDFDDYDTEGAEGRSLGDDIGDPLDQPHDEPVEVAVGATLTRPAAGTAMVERAERAEAAARAESRHRPEPVLVAQGAPLGAGAGGPLTGSSLPGFETPPPPAPAGGADMAAATFVAASEEEPETAAETPSARRSGPARPAPTKTAAAKAGAGKGSGAPAEPVTADVAVSTVAGATMTIEELASATGLTVGDVQQLASFGLLAGRAVGGVTYYDDDALTIARTAAGFARFGIEARHLRFHKHAAEREAGFIEQIVLPLLKQRNPEARQRAHDNVAELTRLGQGLRTVLLRNALRDQLGE